MTGTNVGTVFFKISTNKGAFTKDINSSARYANSAFSTASSAISKSIITAFAVKSAKAVIDFGKLCVSTATQSQNAWYGLSSIINGQGKDFAQANNFIQSYVSDGLVPLNNAVTAYKNLLSRGYNTSQIETVMTALKDSAAYGRAASYSYGDAIQTATEGLKNENSILVDNAGVTKNVSKMWDDYAKSIGTTSNALTQQQKIQAEVNGILQETKWQTGDAARYSNTFAGRLARLSATATAVKTNIGNLIIPIANVFIPVIQSALNVVNRFAVALQNVFSKLGVEMFDISSLSNAGTVAVDTASSIANTGTAAETAAKKAKKAFASFDEINVLNTNSGAGGSSGGGAGAVGGVSSSSGSNETSKADESLSAFELRLADFGAWCSNTITPIYNEVFKPVFNLIGEIISGTVQSVQKAWNNWGKPIWNNIQKAISNTVSIIKSFWKDTLKPIWDNLISGLSEIWSEHLKPLLDNVLDFTGGLINSALEIYNKFVSPIIEWFCNKLGPAASNVFNAISNVVKKCLEYIIDMVNNIITVIKGIVQFVVGVFTGNWKKAWLGVKTAFSGVVASIKDIVGGLKDFFSSIWKAIKSIFSSVKSFFKTAFEGAVASVKIVWKGVKKFFSGVWKDIKKAFPNVKKWFKNIFSEAWTEIKNVFKNVGSFFGGIWTTIKQKFTDIGTKIGSAMSSAFKKAVNSVFATIENVVNSPIKAINSLIGVINKVPGINLGTLKTFILPRLAQGGWVAANNPQLAIIGDNTREGEIVTPESKIYEQVMRALKEMGGGLVKTAVQTVKLAIEIMIKYPDGRTIIKQINEAQIKEGRILLEV